MRQSVQEWTKLNLWKTTFKKSAPSSPKLSKHTVTFFVTVLFNIFMRLTLMIYEVHTKIRIACVL